MRLKLYENSEVESAVKQARTELGEEVMLVSVERAKTAQIGTGRYRVIFAAESFDDRAWPPLPAKNNPLQNGIDSRVDGSKWSLVRFELSQLAADLRRDLSNGCWEKNVALPVLISENAGRYGVADLGLARQQTVQPVIEVLVGPHKSGKSTAAAKLAVLQATSGKKVALVQLLEPGMLFEPELASKGVIECSAESIEHLETIVDVEPRMECVFVDTTPRPGKMTDALRRWISARRASVHLTLDARVNSEDWLAAGIEFKSFLPAHLLLTHVDQITDWAAVWRGIGGTGLPCSYFSAGPHLSSPLECISRAKNAQVEAGKAASA